MDFFAVDVETANSDLSSICQIGLVKFENGIVVDKWQTLVNPEDYFDSVNVSIHGITEYSIKTSPTFPHIEHSLREMLSAKIVACHTPFDRLAISRALSKYSLIPIECTWLDTARVSRRAWTQFAYNGYGLSNLTSQLGIQFQHHVAVEDARAAGEILVRAIQETNISLQDWLIRVEKPIFGSSDNKITREGNPDGILFGEEVVFTGALSMPRQQAADIAAELGCNVGSSVTKNTTLLVVGDQDARRLAGYEKSSKHRKAEELIQKGQSIRIIGEDDFFRLAEKKR